MPNLEQIRIVLVPFRDGGNGLLLQLDGRPWQLSQQIVAGLAG